MSEPADREERARALDSKDNVVVMAGAGTGKTYLLVGKILRKVLEEGVDLTRILALTFTEKAANEMRERVGEELRKRGRTEGLDRAEIGTIHSFCAHVLRRFPVEAGVAPDFKVDEGGAFRRLFERAWPRWLDRELGPKARRPRPWEELLAQVKLEDLRTLAEGLASFSIPEARGDGEKALREFRAMAAAEAPELAEALAGRAEAPKRKPKGKSAIYGSVLEFVHDLRAADAKLVGKAVALVSDFAREFRADYLARGFVSFEAMLSLVHGLLAGREFPHVGALLRKKYEAILVDEFQDTDPVQLEIVRLLAEERPGRLAPGKLFIVGDPKQSIYSFRGADIVSYNRFVKNVAGQGGGKVVLSTNFRSHAGILDFVNDVFSELIRDRGDLQKPYEPIRAREGREPRWPGPHLEAVLIEDAKADESREVEAEEVAEWILRHPEVRPRDVAVLLKALSDVPVYMEALRARGIPFLVHGEKHFFATGEVLDFVNLLRAVANPHDRVAVAGVLRSPFGALPDQQLYERRKALEPSAGSDLAILRFLARWQGEAGRLGVTRLFDRIFEESYALEIARLGYHGEQAVANLLKLRQKAAEMEAEGGCTLREFLESATRAVRELDEEGESPLADETHDAVNILSIHKAKGLEFPVVILPDLHRAPRASSDEAVRYDWPTGTLGVWLGGVCDEGGAALAWLDRERRREEAKRLLYVAATRAEERLVLLGSTKARKDAYVSLLLPELEKRRAVRRVPVRRPGPRPAPSPAAPEKPDWEAFVARWRERERRARLPEKFTTPSKAEDKVTRLLHPIDSPTAAVGTECHAVLERMDFRAPALPEGTGPEAAKILRGFLKSAPFRELAEAEVLARELPFVVRRGEQVVEGVIDVVYRHGGVLWVADYKTDREMRPEEHAASAGIYAEAAERVFGEKPRFKLIYLRHGKAVEV